jgi:uncharacterized protein
VVVHRLIGQRRAEIAALCRRYQVRRLEVFGSAARGSDFDAAASDADFLVSFEPGSDLPPLEHFLRRPVDLVESGAVSNPFLRAEIDRAREVVCAA